MLADNFLRVLRQVFRGESWDDVAPLAQRAWRQVEEFDGRPWGDVAEAMRAGWAA
jgi:hypothetical protein